jgi:response regulator of citrate/malate metabolism
LWFGKDKLLLCLIVTQGKTENIFSPIANSHHMETTTPLLYTLNTDNKDAVTFATEEIRYTILGGINTNHLDRMRVTIKIEVTNRRFPDFMQNEELAGIALRANVDLYHDVQTEKLIRRTAERLEIGTGQLYKGLAQLTEALESYRLQLIEKEKITKPQPKQLTAQETEQVITFLKKNNLHKRTAGLLGTAGIVGEELNRLIMWYVFTSRKLNRPLHIISFGSSGTGKSHLQEKVGELMPDEDKIEITALTQNAFYYFGADELGHKLILIEDFDGALTALYPIRELQSKQRISKTVTIKDSKGTTKAIHLKVQGPVTVAGCTTQESMYEDNANRSFLIYLDESKEQDKKVMQYQRLLAAGKIDHEEEIRVRTFLQNVQRALKPVKIINPYAESLEIPDDVFKPRRTNAHYLGFIEAVTFYHQYQRTEAVNLSTGEIYIETTLEDIAIANELMKEILLRKSDELNKATRSYFEYLKAWLRSEEKESFLLSEVRKALSVSHGSQKRYMSILIDNYFVKKEKTKEGYVYSVNSYEEYKTLKNKVSNTLDEIIQNLQSLPPLGEAGRGHTVHSSPAVQKQNEPMNAGNSNESKAGFKSSAIKEDTAQKTTREFTKITYDKLLEAHKANPQILFTAYDASRLTGRNHRTENRYLKELSDAGLLERVWQDKKYQYKIKLV